MNGKPEWKDAPEWAMWLAQDGDGFWCWFQKKPYLPEGLRDWLWNNGTEYEIAGLDKAGEWRKSLERRP